MNVIMIGTDRKVFDKESAVRARIIEYGSLVKELHLVVFTKKDPHYTKQQLSENVWVYPTRSVHKLRYIFDGIKITDQIIAAHKYTKENTIVSCQDPFETGFVGSRIKAHYEFPLQIQIHTDFLSPYFSQSFLNKIRVWMARGVLRDAHEIRVVSERIKTSLVTKYTELEEKRIDILPIFTDPTLFKNRENGDIDLHKKYPQFEQIIVMASRLEKEKNISFALRILQKVLIKYPKTGLIIVGTGSSLDALKNEAHRLGVSKSVVFEAWQADLFAYYTTSDIFLVTSLYEGYGLTLVEAALSGAVIVTTNVGIAGTILQDGIHAAVSEVGDIKEFVTKVDGLLADRSLRQQLRDRAQADITANILETKQQYLDEYKKLFIKTLES